ncbi:MAG: Ig-like domain-containing protein, partial [Microgenomates group bacterium]
ALFGLLTLISILVFIFLGLPAVAKFAAFLTDLRKSTVPIEINDTTPPAPPILDSLSEYTKEVSIEIAGKTEPGAIVLLFLNSAEEEILANNDGEFSFTYKLYKGENTISAKAKDGAGNESQKTKVYKVTFDNENPDLEVTSPEEGKEFYGSKERQITIEGTTEEGASITINGRIVAVDEDGIFAFFTTLGEGENNFNIKAEDKAGNLTEIDFKVYFTP